MRANCECWGVVHVKRQGLGQEGGEKSGLVAQGEEGSKTRSTARCQGSGAGPRVREAKGPTQGVGLCFSKGSPQDQEPRSSVPAQVSILGRGLGKGT